MKQPDRFERLVTRQATRENNGPACIFIRRSSAIQLLRREHRAVMRIVRAEPELPGTMPDRMWETVRNDREAMEELLRIVVRKTKANILDQLTQRAK